MKKYIDRLVKEWREQGYIIIGLDFDATIYPHYTIENNSDIDRVLAAVLQAQRVGCYVVIHTAATPDRHDAMMTFCSLQGIQVASINKTPIDLTYGKEGSKPFCNIYVDDRGGLIEAVTILEQATIQMLVK